MTDTSGIDPSDFVDPGNFLVAQRKAAQSQAMGALEDNPDDAARALKLADATGAPPALVHSDLEGFEKQHRAMLTSEILNNNEYLRDYVNSHPLAASVSNDDFGQLDAVSKSVRQLSLGRHNFNNNTVLQAGLDSFSQNMEGPIGRWMFNSPSDMEKFLHENPGIGAALAPIAMVGAPLEAVFRTGGAALAGVGAAAKQSAINYGYDEKTANQIEEFFTIAPLAAGMDIKHIPPELQQLARDAQRTTAAVKPFLDAKIEPPARIDPLIDKLKTEQAKTDGDNLAEALAESAKSTTRERDPALYARFVAQHTDARIAISAEAIRNLYGEKLPASNDGVLGWIPDLQDQLRSAEAGGGDVEVPLSEWLARVEPEVARDLHDDIRVRPGGLTVNEAKELDEHRALEKEVFGEPEAAKPEEAQAAEPPTPRIADQIPEVEAIRRGALLDKQLSIGAIKKLKLQKTDQGTGAFANVHDFDLVGEDGKRLGDLQITDKGSDLYVEMINGYAGGGPQAFGPKVMIDLLRQLKAAFPEAKTISGDRVSGARERAAYDKLKAAGGGELQVGAQVSVPLDKAFSADHMSDLSDLIHHRADPLPDGYFRQDTGHGGYGIWKASELYTENEKAIKAGVDAVAQRLVPRLVEVLPPAQKLGMGAAQEYGFYSSFRNRLPMIAWSFDFKDPQGTMKHEAIHHLRKYGFFKGDDWSILQHAAVEGGWLEKYNIRRRYPGSFPVEHLEEAIAERFADWARAPSYLPAGLKPVFERMLRLLNGIRTAVREALGKDVDFKDLFTKADSGEIGSRRDAEPIREGAFKTEGFTPEGVASSPLMRMSSKGPKEPELPGMTRLEDRDLFDKGQAMGMTQKHYSILQGLMDKRDAEDTAYAAKKALREIERRQTQEWKENANRIRSEVQDNISNRPDIAADEFLRTGLLHGERVPRPRLNADKLTAGQKDSLPKGYYGVGGIDPDDAAGLFGYQSGQALIERVGMLNRAREEAGLKPEQYKRQLVEAEVERRMQKEHGDLATNILEEAKDHVLSLTEFDKLHEETLALATQSGLEMSLTKEQMKAAVKDSFKDVPIGSLASDKYLANAGRSGTLAERAILEEKYRDAFRYKQQQYIATLMAKEALGWEREKKQFDRITDRFTQRVVPNFPPEFTNAIHSIMMKLGIAVKRSVEDLGEEVRASGYDTIQDFIQARNDQGLVDGTIIPVPDFIFDPTFQKQLEALTVDEFREVKQGLDSLLVHGRGEQKINVAGAKADLREWVKDGVAQLEQKFPPQKYPATLSRYDKTKLKFRQYIAAITNMETFFGRLDGRDPQGRFTKAIIYPGAEAANHYNTLQREFSRFFNDIANLKDPHELIEPPFVDPQDGQPWQRFTRKNLEAVIANIGNKENLKALIEGYDIGGYKGLKALMGQDEKANPKDIEAAALQHATQGLFAWIERNTTEADINRAQRRGEIFNEAWERYKTVERNVNGVAPASVEPTPFTLHGKEFQGWYHPIIDDPIRSQKEYQISNAEDKPHSFWPTVASGFTKQRTGAKHVLDLNIDMASVRLNQVLHAVAFKEFVNNTNKIFRDREFRAGVRDFYGHEYLEEMDTWLRDVAGNASVDSKMAGEVTKLSNYFRQNVMSTYIAFNPSTIQKHGLSAWAMSAKEVGLTGFAKITAEVAGDSFYHAVADLFSKDPYLGNTLWQFIKNNSEEIARRDRNWQETLMGQEDILYGRSTLRNRVAQWGSKGVALSDMVSAAPLWLARYREAFDELGEHGPAVEEANRVVRRAHGSTAITNQPRFVRRAGPLGSWMTTLYGFFGTVMQRRVELAHDLNDTWKLGMEGEIKAAAKNVPGIASSVFTYVIWPAVVEEIVSSEFTDDKRGLGTKIASGLLGGIASTFLFLRDITYGLLHNKTPGVGLAQGPLDDITKLMRDVEKKKGMFSKEAGGKTVQDMITVFGDFTGLTPKALGSAARFGLDLARGQQKPKSFPEWYRGIVRGDIKKHTEK